MTAREPKRFKLVRAGDGWSEPQNPPADLQPDAWRVICEDPACPFQLGGIEHSHIVEVRLMTTPESTP